MNYESIKIFIKNNLLDSQNNISSSRAKKFECEINDILKEHWGKSISELNYCIINSIIEEPKCYCGNSLPFIKMSKGYQKYCSNQCSTKSPERIEKIKATNLERYGVDNPAKLNSVKEKIKATCLNNFSNTNPMKNIEIKNKIKQTNLERYGVENPFQSEEIKEKIKLENLNNLGVEFPVQSKEIKEKIKTTNIKKYGVENVSQDKNIKEKRKKNNLIKWGVDNPSKLHILNYNNYNKKFINQNFQNKNGFLNKEEIKKYFNISGQTLFPSKLNIEDLLPFENVKNKTQNEIYNLIYNEEIKNEKYRKNLSINNRNYINLKDNNDKVKKTLELDILDLNKNLAIEYNGLMFHSFGLSNHSMFNNSDKESEDKNLHLIKTQLCEEKGIQLFHIFENEWLNERQRNIWISMINGKLNKHERIYARKTIVKEIKLKDKKGNITNKNDTDTIRNFLNTNHMQGYLPSTVNIGLFVINNEINPNTGIIEEKEELVSMIALSKPRMSKKYQWELIRYATKLNTTIVGGGSKLISFFEKIYNPESLISYANRRWSTGQFYKKTGFTFSHYSDPNYYYFKPELLSKVYKNDKINENLLYSRNQFQKHKLEGYFLEGKLSFFDENLTETQNMFLNGQRKIYDSGNMIFTKIYN